jgi:hypothetical protein
MNLISTSALPDKEGLIFSLEFPLGENFNQTKYATGS